MTDKTALNVLIDCCFGGPEQDALREQALAEYAALEADSRRLRQIKEHLCILILDDGSISINPMACNKMAKANTVNQHKTFEELLDTTFDAAMKEADDA